MTGDFHKVKIECLMDVYVKISAQTSGTLVLKIHLATGSLKLITSCSSLRETFSFKGKVLNFLKELEREGTLTGVDVDIYTIDPHILASPFSILTFLPPLYIHLSGSVYHFFLLQDRF